MLFQFPQGVTEIALDETYLAIGGPCSIPAQSTIDPAALSGISAKTLRPYAGTTFNLPQGPIFFPPTTTTTTASTATYTWG